MYSKHGKMFVITTPVLYIIVHPAVVAQSVHSDDIRVVASTLSGSAWLCLAPPWLCYCG